MSNNISYHTRLRANNTVKVVGGSFGGAIDQDTVERLVKSCMAEVRVLPSGTLTFVDRQGREVSLYLSVDPQSTEMGKKALRAYHEEKLLQWKLDEERRGQQQAELDEAMVGLTHDEIIRRLKKGD